MRRIISIMYLVLSLPLFAEVEFTGLNLAEDNMLMFCARSSSPVFGYYTTAFETDLKKKSIGQLTFFPENAVLLRGGEQLQLQNRFGVFRTDSTMSDLVPVDKFPSFVNGAEIVDGKINTVCASPDGNYLIYLKPVSTAYADLYLFDVINQKELLISRNVKKTFTGPGASWSPDSGFFIYVKKENLYYFSVEQYLDDRLISEDYRKLGRGDISSIQWSGRNYLYYLSGSLVYQIISTEFFTRSLYADVLKVGEIVGKVPFQFDPAFDSFSISPDGTKILLSKSGQNVFLYYLRSYFYSQEAEIRSLPYLFLPRNTVVRKILWSPSDLITILTSRLVEAEIKTAVYRLDLGNSDDSLVFSRLEDEGIVNIEADSNFDQIALVKDNEVRIKKYVSWLDTAAISHPRPLHCLWKDDDQVVIAGVFKTEIVEIKSRKSRRIAFSQADRLYFDEESGKPVLEQTTAYFIRSNKVWTEYKKNTLAEPLAASAAYRVYFQPLTTGHYRNMLMVRNIVGFGTEALFAYPGSMYEAFPENTEPVDPVRFDHGSRIRRREVALVFNAIDGVEGLTSILNVLKEYNLNCTFFVNGEFIRRHPEAAGEIAESGHEVGSLFYAYFDMTDSRYIITKEYIKQGLARNEDEYFAATGSELALLWHTPYYFVNSDIVAASSEMNYRYIGRDVNPLDWLALRNTPGSVADLIERIVSLKKPGSIIPIRVGLADDGKTDYLFTNLDLLINSLMLLGYEIKPVSALIEHAR
ncbi:MAG: polysaccharide deacetylase family protein [Spirochaetales bacterium]|nr:polysaccharide deacetylase family protein [Spirochaetales bacterium]